MSRLVAALCLLFAVFIVSTPAHAQKRGDRNHITRQDLEESGSSVTTALDAVQKLRPQWLRPPLGRSASSGMGYDQPATSNATEPVVYIDDKRQPVGAMDALRTVRAPTIADIKYLDQNRAVQMYGPGHEAGAILVVTLQAR